MQSMDGQQNKVMLTKDFEIIHNTECVTDLDNLMG
jgi:hypothetical protein